MTKHLLSLGQRFDRLEVIREVEKKNGRRHVLCRCDCGKETVVNLYKLLEKRTRSCGCLNREIIVSNKTKDLTGREFTWLKVLHRDGDKVKNKSIFWVCECKCGKIVSVLSRDLLSEGTRSCGCLLTAFISTLQSDNEQNKTIDGVFVPILTKKVQTNSMTGVKGVSVQRQKNGTERYVANITIKNKRHYLGIFDEKEDAIRARQKAEEEFHKPYIDRFTEKNKEEN